MSLTKTQIEGRTGNLLVLDGINLTVVIPFLNFFKPIREPCSEE
jgi:hypothetical protein